MADDAEVRIRPMTEADLPHIHVLEERNHPYPWTFGILRDCLRQESFQALVYEWQGEVSGFAIMQLVADESHLLNICIDQPLQRQGHGRRLLEHLTEALRSQGASVLFLEVRPSNAPAIDLYARSGFNEIGRRNDYYPSKSGREDAIVMARTLGDAFR